MNLSKEELEAFKTKGMLATFSDAECHALFDAGQVSALAPGERLFGRNQWADEFGWVVSGHAEIILPATSGDIKVIDAGPGHALGYIAFISRGRHILEVFATSHLEVFLINNETLVKAKQRGDKLFDKLLLVLAAGAFERMEAVEAAVPSNRLTANKRGSDVSTH